MAPLLLWTAVIAAASCIGSSAMPLLPEMERLSLSPQQTQALAELVQAWQMRELEREMDQQQQQLQLQPSVQDLRQLKQWLEMQMARLELEDPAPSTPAPLPPQPKRGNYMALCHFKICNMGRKRSPRPQTQDLP